jgi:hypothetical protein
VSERLTVRMWEPVQAHRAIQATVWPQLKAMLMAGHRMVVEVKPETRSLEQNARLWAMLTEISEQVAWYGNKLTPEEWKDVFSAAMKRAKVVPGLDGGFVVCGQSTSKMTRAEMNEMQTLMEAFGAERGVVFTERTLDPETGELVLARRGVTA